MSSIFTGALVWLGPHNTFQYLVTTQQWRGATFTAAEVVPSTGRFMDTFTNLLTTKIILFFALKYVCYFTVECCEAPYKLVWTNGHLPFHLCHVLTLWISLYENKTPITLRPPLHKCCQKQDNNYTKTPLTQMLSKTDKKYTKTPLTQMSG